VHADGMVIGVLAAEHRPRVLPELETHAAVVIHVVLAAQVPDHVVGVQALLDVAPPAAHFLPTNPFINVRVCSTRRGPRA